MTFNHEKNEVGSGLFLRIDRCASYREILDQHLPFAIIPGVILATSYCLPLNKISFHLCLFLCLTGYPCPTCGWTRGFVSMAHGDWQSAFYDCPIAAILYVFTAIIFACNMAALICGVRISRGPLLQFNTRKAVLAVIFCFFAVLINWIYRLTMGFK